MIDLNDLTSEFNETMEGLDDFIAKSVDERRASRSGKFDDDDEADEQEEPERFEASQRGLRRYEASASMQQLKRDDPDEYAKRIHAFIDEHELVKSHQLGPTQVAMLEQLLSALPRTKARRPVMTKATAHADNSPEPWNYEPNERGLNQFLHSPQMKALEHSRPALWREHHMKFFSELVPAPMPGEVSVRRMALESLCPDDPRQSTVAKAIAQAGRLTTGQSVLVSNFGSSIGDPSVWLRR